MANVYEVLYKVVKLRTAPATGAFDHKLYLRDTQKALVLATSPGGCLAVLNSNTSLASGESIEILFIGNGHALSVLQ